MHSLGLSAKFPQQQMQFAGQQDAQRQSQPDRDRPATLPSPTPPPPILLRLPSVSLGKQPTELRPRTQDAASKGHPNVAAPGLLALIGGPYRFTVALTPGHRQARQKTAQLSLVSLKPSVSAESRQTKQGEKRWEAIMEPYRRELLALWQQSLAQAMTEVEAMFRSRRRAVPRQTAAAGGGGRRPQGGAAAPGAPGRGAGPLPGPALFTEEDAGSLAVRSLTEGYYLAAAIHKGHGCEKVQHELRQATDQDQRLLQTELLQKEHRASSSPERPEEDEGKHRQLEFMTDFNLGTRPPQKKPPSCS